VPIEPVTLQSLHRAITTGREHGIAKDAGRLSAQMENVSVFRLKHMLTILCSSVENRKEYKECSGTLKRLVTGH
jgi:hypothetical protein